MKLLVVLALFVAIACALPAEEVSQIKEAVESPLTIVDLEVESSDDGKSDAVRAKRQWGFGGFGGYNRYGGYGGYGHGHHHGHHHHHHHHGHHRHRGHYWGK